MVINYLVGQRKMSKVIKDDVKKVFLSDLNDLVDNKGFKIKQISDEADLDYRKLMNIRNNNSSGNKEMLEKLYSSYHYMIFQDENTIDTSSISPDKEKIEKLEEEVQTLKEKMAWQQQETKEIFKRMAKVYEILMEQKDK